MATQKVDAAWIRHLRDERDHLAKELPIVNEELRIALEDLQHLRMFVLRMHNALKGSVYDPEVMMNLAREAKQALKKIRTTQ